MKYLERAIVLLELPGGKQIDVDMPLLLSVEKIKEKLLDMLKSVEPGLFLAVTEIDLVFMGKKLENEDTLASRGIWEGSLLEIQTRR